jgi:TRAP-type C4-dicarboxylate transport system permease large subunit
VDHVVNVENDHNLTKLPNVVPPLSDIPQKMVAVLVMAVVLVVGCRILNITNILLLLTPPLVAIVGRSKRGARGE